MVRATKLFFEYIKYFSLHKQKIESRMMGCVLVIEILQRNNGTFCVERGIVWQSGKPRLETTNTLIYHFRNARLSVLHHFENRYSHYRGVSTGSNSSFPGIRGFRNSLAPNRSPRDTSNRFARDETRNTVTPLPDNRLIIAVTVYSARNMHH